MAFKSPHPPFTLIRPGKNPLTPFSGECYNRREEEADAHLETDPGNSPEG